MERTGQAILNDFEAVRRLHSFGGVIIRRSFLGIREVSRVCSVERSESFKEMKFQIGPWRRGLFSFFGWLCNSRSRPLLGGDYLRPNVFYFGRCRTAGWVRRLPVKCRQTRAGRAFSGAAAELSLVTGIDTTLGKPPPRQISKHPRRLEIQMLHSLPNERRS